jgi:putative transposase
MIDIFSRFVVGWMVSNRENAHQAQHFIRETVRNNGPLDDVVVAHSDNGPQMTAGGTVELFSLLGLVQSFSRPRVSDDNPYSESQFKTLKYHRFFPGWFSSQEFAEHKMEQFFQWYNYEHMHSGLNLLTPQMVHHGLADQIVKKRQAIIDHAVECHPERFSKATAEVKHNPCEVYINFNPNVNERRFFELSLDK